MALYGSVPYPRYIITHNMVLEEPEICLKPTISTNNLLYRDFAVGETDFSRLGFAQHLTYIIFLVRTWSKKYISLTSYLIKILEKETPRCHRFVPKFSRLTWNVGLTPEGNTKTKNSGRMDTVYYSLAKQGGRLWTLNLPAFPPFSCIRRQLLWFTFVLGLHPYRSLGTAGHVRLNPASPLQQ